ncbi:hypothetical protein HWV62_13287 [Athelia sp. TMB]|nr:hypothetical protein HWV62_13287 [Athelia sp. TMB]
MSLDPPAPRAWWKSAVVYEVYPSSFCDTTGAGHGDLNGIASKLDYLKDLGVDVIWLTPVYTSPMADMGYDIADYTNINARYGTLEDWDRLLKSCHDRGMKLMMDLVVNHTSDQHAWFKESRDGGKDITVNPKRDWYIWRPPSYDADGNRCPPNNWKSVFQGSAWTYDPGSEEYYLHLFASEQPDLNWENEEMREAVWGVMEFWIARGCDGFRMDVINLISKTPGLPNAPVADPQQPFQDGHLFFANGPRVHEYIKTMHARVLAQPGRDLITVGETPFTFSPETLAAYVLPGAKELNMVFQFELMEVDSVSKEGELWARSGVRKEGEGSGRLYWQPWRMGEMKAVVAKWQQCMRKEGFWNAVYIENHDQARSVSRFGNDSPAWRARSAKMLALFQTTQTGTLFVFQGEELGLKNFPRSWGIEEYKDVATINYYNLVLEQRRKEMGREDVDMSDFLDGAAMKARDHARLPMHWDASANAGFTSGTPWMRVNDDYKEWNAAAQVGDEGSVWSFWKKALATRKANEVLVYGNFKTVDTDSEQIFAYTRTLGDIIALVVLNFGEMGVSVKLGDFNEYKLLLSNYEDEALLSEGGLAMRGYEGRVYLRQKARGGYCSLQ